MTSSVRSCCIPNCGKTRRDNVILHAFPDPIVDNDRFIKWVNAVGSSIASLDDQFIYKNRKICQEHFDQRYSTWTRKLSPGAVPTLHIPGLQSIPGDLVLKVSKEFDANDHSISTECPTNEGISPTSKGEFVLGQDKLQICRICLEIAEHPTNLFCEEKSSKAILEKIYECFQITLHFEHHLPSLICNTCIKELEICYIFRVKCLSFEERYSSLCREKESCLLRGYTSLPEDSKIEEYSTDVLEDSVDIPNDNTLVETDELGIREETFTCTICNKNLKSKLSLLRHNMSMHQKRKHLGKVTGFGANRRYHCTKCSYCTPHSQTLVNHMRRHNGDRPYSCECGKNFTQYASLAAHRKIHTDVTYFTCTTCGKQFKHAFTLKKHLNVHETGKYTCNVCHKSLKSTQSLRDHMHRHYNIRNYNCEDCGDTFVTCSELINHKKKHSKIKKIECHLCGYKTHTKKNLIIHLKRHTGDKAFKCGLCEQTFYTSSGLRLHHRVHTREKPFTCPTCAQRFTHSTSLNKHMRTVHGLNYKWGDYKFKEVNRNKKSTKLVIKTM